MDGWKTKKYGNISMAETSITVMIKINVCVSEIRLNMWTGRSRGLAPGKLTERSECHAIGKIYVPESGLTMCTGWRGVQQASPWQL